MATSNQSLSASPVELSMPKPKKSSGLERQQRLWGWIFLSPWIIGFLLFTAIPIVVSLVFTFTDFTLTSDEPMRFVGLANWQRLFTDPIALTALGVTLRFALIAVPFGILIPLGLAALLNAKNLWGKALWRPLFYMPYVVPAISSIFVWQSFLNGDTGWLNRILRGLGVVEPPNWVQDANWILPAFMLVGVWGVGNAMLTMLATMQGVPTELYEAADVDGANPLVKFLRITLPMISPVILYNLVLSVIGLMQYFTVPYVMTRGTGNPGNSALFFNMYLYKTAFQNANMGYGATQAWFLFLIALVLTVALFGTSNRWVYYASGD